MRMYKKTTQLTSELIALQPIIQPLLVAGYLFDVRLFAARLFGGLFLKIDQDPEGIGRRKVIHHTSRLTTFQVFRVPPPHLVYRPLDVTKGKVLRDTFGHGVCVRVSFFPVYRWYVSTQEKNIQISKNRAKTAKIA
jgi:hypothetical protein